VNVNEYLSTVQIERLDAFLNIYLFQRSDRGDSVAAWEWPLRPLYRGADKSLARNTSRCILFDGGNISFDASLVIHRVSQKEWTKLRESIPYVKIYRYNPKHLCPKLNGYRDKGQRKVWSFCGSTYCTWFAWRNTHTLRIVRPCQQLAQARSSLRLHM